MKPGLTFFGALIIFSAVALGFVSCQGGASQAASGTGQPGGPGKGGRSGAISVQVVEVASGDLISENSTSGVVTPEVQSSVAANCTGVILSVSRVAGDWVQQGAVVARLDDSQLKLNLKLAQANLDQARINLGLGSGGDSATGTTIEGGSKLQLQVDSAQSALASAQKSYASAQALFKIGGISGSDLDNAQNALQTAQANLESAKMTMQESAVSLESATLQVQQAQISLDQAIIRAPFAGQISAVNVHAGEYVGPSTIAFILVSNRRQVNFNVPPSDVSGLTVGTMLSFNFIGRNYPARISQLPGAPISGLVPLVAVLDASANLNFGVVGTVAYKVTVARGLLVPVNALLSDEGKPYVFLVKDNKTIKQPVNILGQTGADSALSGFSLPAYVVINPPPGLLPDSNVQAIASAEAPGSTTVTTLAQEKNTEHHHHKHQETQQ